MPYSHLQSQASDDLTQSAAILIVDDMALMRKMIHMTLSQAGFTNLFEADDGDIALQKIAEIKPDIVILDINMPRMSGYEVCKAVRDNPETADMPVLVQSASETAEERVKVFEAGATDFVSKPINQRELLARVGLHLQNRFLIRDLIAFRARIAAELDLARQMQTSLLPDQDLQKDIDLKSNVAIASTYRSSSELGGDLWGAWPLADGKFGVYVLDVTGHGVASALSTFRIHATTRRFEDLHDQPLDFMKNLNAELVENFPTGQFATMFYGVYDPKTRLMTYVGAGSPPPLLCMDDDLLELDSAGLPLGISPDANYEMKTIKIPVSASLILYSDVLIEAKDDKGDMIGLEGLKAQITEAHQIGSNAPGQVSLHDTLYKNFETGIGEGPLPDDLTLVEIQFS